MYIQNPDESWDFFISNFFALNKNSYIWTNIVLKNISRPKLSKMKKSFGEFIRELREKEGMPLRKVAAFIDIDASTLSKIERGERNANKDIIPSLSQILNISENELLLTLLSDTVAESLIYENNSSEILKVAEEKIKYLKSKNFQQGNLKFD